MRSAKAPIIRAGVMMMNMPWNITNTNSGMVPLSESGVMPESPTRERSPIQALPSPKARL